jgi:amino acid adenylation domain-containing protein
MLDTQQLSGNQLLRETEDSAGDTLAGRFARVCAQMGSRTAITLGMDSITYDELDLAAEEIRAGLVARGVSPGAIVAICMERSIGMIAAMVGVVKAGAAYLPIDPRYPQARVAETIEDASPLLMVGVGGVSLDELMSGSGSKGAPFQGDPDAAAYVIYTSGSTGKPKGVVVSNRNVIRLLDATKGWFDFNESDVWTMFHSFAFDFSVWEIWGSLLHGGRLVIVPFEVSRSPEDFRSLLVRERVTVLNQTPSAFALLDQVDAQAGGRDLSLRVVIFGGEALVPGALRRWTERHGDAVPQMINMYGITETTVHVTYRRVTALDAQRERESLLGEPIPDMQVHLLDEGLRGVAAGEAGEFGVGGGGVAKGYLNRPELTAQRFVQDPFGVVGEMLYRSGDMARRRADGELVYLGRRDGQVKVAGFRIELGEVEAALMQHADVVQACVLAKAADGAGTRLAAYVVGRPGVDLTVAELSGFLGTRLPSHMMPAFYRVLGAMPLTTNGKVDRAALPDEHSVQVASLGTSTTTEEKVAVVWRRVLGVGQVGVEDNFFDVGGSSLLLIAVRTGLQAELNCEIPVVWMFECTTIRSLARRIEDGNAAPVVQTAAVDANARRQRMAFARARAARGGSQ